MASLQPESDLGRLDRIEAHISARLEGIAPLLASDGVAVRYLPPARVCEIGQTGAASNATAETREIRVEVDGLAAGVVHIAPAEGGSFAVGLLEQLIQAWSEELAGTLREEALLDELSASWESLEALYEVSSSLSLSNTPEAVLEGLLKHAVPMGSDLSAALWLLRPDGSIGATALHHHAPIADLNPTGPFARCIETRQSLLINGRPAILAFPDNPAHLTAAHQLVMAPIVTGEGVKGVLSVWRSCPGRELTSHLLRLVEALAHQAGLVIDNDRLNRAFVESARIRRDLEIGSTIQQTLLLGRTTNDLPWIRVAAVSKPSQTVDGDFYDFIHSRAGCLDVLVGDVMGKGVAAALLGAAVKSAFLRAMARVDSESHGGGVAEVVRMVHHSVVPDLLRLESFSTLCFARFELSRRSLEFVDCGHPRSIHYRRAQGDWAFLEGSSVPLGFSAAASYEAAHTTFAPGDIFLFYSDGLPEACDADGNLFGAERIAAVVAEHASLPGEDILKAIERAIVGFSGSEQMSDDYTCVLVEVAGELPVAFVSSAWSATLQNGVAMREWLLQHMRDVTGLPQDDLIYWAVELAAGEVFTNLVEHAYENNPAGLVRVEAGFYPDRMVLRLIHWGDPMDPWGVPPPDFEGGRDNGFGVFLVANVMDSVVYKDDPQAGHSIEMEKRYPRCSE